MPPTPRVVILAAGASERLGQPKATAILAGRTALAHLIDACGDPNPLLITGAHTAEITIALGGESSATDREESGSDSTARGCNKTSPRAELLHHPTWSTGRSGSIACAIRHLPQTDLILTPIDCPLLPAHLFDALRQAWHAAGSPARGWLAPYDTNAERHGHPILIGRALAAELLPLDPDTPLRHIRTLADPLLQLPIDAPEILDNLDTPEDLAALQRRAAE
jgi:CTP:molybdopterin cytidylyltransferase MocA